MMCIPQWKDANLIINELKQSGVGLLHVDVMDGNFVPNLMLGTEGVKQLREVGGLPLDIHLMIDRAEDKLGWFDFQPGEYVSIHVESTNHLQRALSYIRSLGAHPMVALNPATPLCALEELIDDVDAILLMTVNPGYAGQALVPQTLRKIARLRTMLDDAGRPEVRIQVDGNVSFANAPKMLQAGADMFVCGTSSIFHKDGTISQNMARFMHCLEDSESEVV